jgi:hypothetical protein
MYFISIEPRRLLAARSFATLAANPPRFVLGEQLGGQPPARSYRTIDKALGRHSGATQQRLEIAGYGSGHEFRSKRIPEELLAERDALTAAREQRALTQDFFGDPPPGYSALHGKTGLR